MKPDTPYGPIRADDPAAFRRLCVETLNYTLYAILTVPAAFRRLCVETEFCSSTHRF